jgi:DNA-binding NarL/FixJ family response regulator
LSDDVVQLLPRQVDADGLSLHRGPGPGTAVAVCDADPFARLFITHALTADPGLRLLGRHGSLKELLAHASPGAVAVIDPIGLSPVPADAVSQLVDAEWAVVVVSADLASAGVGACLQAGASALLSKEADVELLPSAIVAAASGHVVLPPALARLVGRAYASAPISPQLDAANLKALSRLTPTEQQVLQLLGSGAGTVVIAAALGVGCPTARTHVSHVVRKLGLTSRAEAALFGSRYPATT